MARAHRHPPLRVYQNDQQVDGERMGRTKLSRGPEHDELRNHLTSSVPVSGDERTTTSLLESGWRVANVRECSLKGPAGFPEDEVIRQCRTFLLSEETILINIRGAARTHDE